MNPFSALLKQGHPVIMPGAHDALTARLIEDAGFAAYGIGGSAVAATQLALPDVGLLSFAEYRDAVARIMDGSRLPVMVDGENGFGDAKAVTRTVRSFERVGVAALALEDLSFPPRLGVPPSVISIEDMSSKLRSALAARTGEMMIIGRTDAAYAVGLDDAIGRLKAYEALGCDALLATGLSDLDAMKRVRDAVKLPLIAVVVEGIPWFAPTHAELAEAGFEMALYPATLMMRAAGAMVAGLEAIRRGSVTPSPDALSFPAFAQAMRVAEWTVIDGEHG
jgi:2-methylisocitrate lyase-like PEP mutase family enzyme